MSTLCPASAAILTFSDADLVHISPQSQSQSQSRSKRKQRDVEARKRLLERSIDVRLECEFSDGRLVVKSWGGTEGWCGSGSCEFCYMFGDGVERVCGGELGKRDGGVGGCVGLSVVVGKVEVRRDAGLWVSAEGRERERRDIHLLLFRAMAVFSSGIPGIEKARGFPVDVAFEFSGREEDPIVTALRISRRPLEEYPLSPLNVEKIQRWMRDCDANHEKCPKDIQLDYLPTRLLDVGTLQCSHDPKLILSAEAFPNHGSKPIYMALSYCWGAPEDLRDLLTTTRETLSARRTDIKITSMPQTFQDAVRTARALGIRYLWIDSLCIIQDNEDDWKAESGRMAETFSTAYLTVIAASSDSCHEGFLQRRERPSCSVPVVLTNPMSTPGSSSIEGTFSLRYRHLHWGSDKMAETKLGRWISRGWTFQEERLARRALIFGEGKLFLDCRTLERTEDTALYKHRPDWVETVRESACEEAIEPGALKRSNTGSAYLHRRTPYDHWRTLCNHYSRRTLTYEKDKLPAISGMARQILKKDMAESAYLAGLWRENLLHDLFWQPVEGGRKPAVYRAPSWSWAAIEGHISWPTWRYCVEGECEIYCEVVDAWTRTDSLDPFGAVTGGSLRICGAVSEVEMLGIGAESVSKQGPRSLTWEGNLVATGRLDTAIPDGLGNMRYWALLIAKCKVKEGKPAVPRGLLLEKRVCDDGTEEFERVGIFKVVADDKEGRSPLEAWQSLGKQTITII